MSQKLPRVQLRPRATHRCEEGHPWIYSSEIGSVSGSPEPGAIVDVWMPGAPARFIGRGYYNPKSQITIRLLTRDPEEVVDRAFLARRLREAFAWRQRFLEIPDYARIVFGEGDRLPGLILERYGDVFVAQVLTMGMERWKSDLVSLLVQEHGAQAILERSDVAVRRLEGLEETKGWLHGSAAPVVEIREHENVVVYADLLNGQKTGYFYDQRQNRRALKPMVTPGAEVLDCFCYVGAFSMYAGRFGAGRAEAMDSSADALAMVARGAKANGLDGVVIPTPANVFDALREYDAQGRRFDLIILDPPAFSKGKQAIEGALRGYKEINLRALRILRPGGFLVTCSCSHHIRRDAFVAMVVDAAKDARRELRQVDLRGAGPDHPVLPVAPETEYLKFLAVQAH